MTRVVELELESEAIKVMLESESVKKILTLTPTTSKEIFKHDINVMWSYCLSNDECIGGH